MHAKKVVVTGGSGGAGQEVIKHLLAHNYEVLNVDVITPRKRNTPYTRADLQDLGQTIEVLHGADAIIHLAAIPSDKILTDEQTFRINTLSTYNIFHAATLLNIKRVVWASSARAMGITFTEHQPAYLPLDEAHPTRMESSYSLSKIVGEEMARQFHLFSGTTFIGLRFSHIIFPDHYDILFPPKKSPERIRGELWAYVDARDAAQSCRLALEAKLTGAEVFNITANDTSSELTSQELIATHYPHVPVHNQLAAHTSLISIRKAQELLGYQPQYEWRRELPPHPHSL